MTVITAAGAKLYIGGVGNATAGPVSEAAYVLVGEIENLGEFGREYELVTFASLSDRGVRKFKGTYNDGNLPLTLGNDVTDAGQQDIEAASNTDSDYNFKIELNDASGLTGSTPTTYYFQGKVMSWRTVVNEVNSIVRANANIEIQSGSLSRVNAVG